MSVIHSTASGGGEAVEMVTVTIAANRITVYDYKGVAHTESFETPKGTVLVVRSSSGDSVEIEGDYQSVFYVPGGTTTGAYSYGGICIQENLTITKW